MTKAAPAIISLEEYTESINMLIYGDSGVGKTVFAGSFSAGTSLFLATENGTISAKRQGSTSDLWKIDEWDDLQAAYNWLADNPNAYNWVMIDSITVMQRKCMRAILNAAVAENKSRDPDIPAIQDWQKYYNMFERFVAAFNDLPINTLYTATTMRSENEDSEDIVLPDIQGKGYHMAQSVCASMGVVGFLKAQTLGKGDDAQVNRKILFQSQPPYFAKDRYAVFPRWVSISEGDKQLTTLDHVTRTIEGKPRTASKKVTQIRRRPAAAGR